jgi:hypothetical protein
VQPDQGMNNRLLYREKGNILAQACITNSMWRATEHSDFENSQWLLLRSIEWIHWPPASGFRRQLQNQAAEVWLCLEQKGGCSSVNGHARSCGKPHDPFLPNQERCQP